MFQNLLYRLMCKANQESAVPLVTTAYWLHNPNMRLMAEVQKQRQRTVKLRIGE